jgi:hypothetical protein
MSSEIAAWLNERESYFRKLLMPEGTGGRERDKARVTFYYLLAEKYGKLSMFK